MAVIHKVTEGPIRMLKAGAGLETLRLTEELQKRARELKELDRLKSAFLANMSP